MCDNFKTCRGESWHATHLKLVEKMCRYERDPASIVEDTGTRFGLQTDGRTDRRMDRVKPVYPLNLVGGVCLDVNGKSAKPALVHACIGTYARVVLRCGRK